LDIGVGKLFAAFNVCTGDSETGWTGDGMDGKRTSLASNSDSLQIGDQVREEDAAAGGIPRRRMARNRKQAAALQADAVSAGGVVRIQLSREKDWRMPANTRKVDRATIFGNPFPIEKYGRAEAMALYRDWLTGAMTNEAIKRAFPALLSNHLIAKRGWVLDALPNLRGQNLACWCAKPEMGQPDLCHAAFLMELANQSSGSK
jgi:hypothetical protein